MKKIVLATLLTLTSASTFLAFTKPAQAGIFVEPDIFCYPVTSREIRQNPADHPGAYADGYSEGRRSASKGESFKPRTAGGEFARGFDDGYYGRSFTGQEYNVPDKVTYNTTSDCNTYSFYGGLGYYPYGYYFGGLGYYPFGGLGYYPHDYYYRRYYDYHPYRDYHREGRRGFIAPHRFGRH
jgi:hypothetical protein